MEAPFTILFGAKTGWDCVQTDFVVSSLLSDTAPSSVAYSARAGKPILFYAIPRLCCVDMCLNYSVGVGPLQSVPSPS